MFFITSALSVALVLQTNYLHADTPRVYHDMHTVLKKQQSFIDCLPSTIASGVVGAFTGWLTRYLEKEFNIEQSKEFIIALMVMWWAEHKVRHKVINSLEKDFTEADIAHRKSWMSLFAWGSSWVSYLKA